VPILALQQIFQYLHMSTLQDGIILRDKLVTSSSKLKAWKDIVRGLSMYSVWWGLAWLEIKQRYSRSMIGPFWITISMAIMIGAMGPLYGALFGQNVPSYIQNLAVSLIMWNFISTCINEAGSVFIGAENYIKQVSLPFSVYVFKLISKNSLILSHNAVIGIVVLIILPPQNFQNIFLFPIGLMLVIGNLCCFVLLIGIFSARFRDLPQLVTNIMQVMFFLSPILWTADMLPDNRRYLADLNPIYHLIEVVRSPLLGYSPPTLSWAICFGFLFVGGVVSFFIYARYRARIPYWL
jgi:ABC-type polysaccharide/polyol phosphate export permease